MPTEWRPLLPLNLATRRRRLGRPPMHDGHPEGWPLLSYLRRMPYRSLFQLIRSPRVVVELETGALWLSFL